MLCFPLSLLFSEIQLLKGGVSLALEVLPVTLSPTRERWLGPWAALVWPGEGDGRLLCLPWQLPLAEHFTSDCLLQERLLRRLAACLSGISSPLCDVSSLQGLAEQRRRALGASSPRTHSQRPQLRSWLTLCTQDALVIEL